MEKDSLKKWRLYLPGIFILILSFPYRTNSISELKNISPMFQNLKLDDLYLLIVIVFSGTIYYSLEIRSKVWRTHIEEIQTNIKTRLLSLCTESLTPEIWYKIITGRYLMTVFYSFIDNDESLKDKAKDVRFNGLIWSSCVDIIILSGLAGFVYWVIALVNNNKSHLIFLSPVLFILSFLSSGLSYLLKNRHRKLSDEQLDVISQRFKNKVNKEIHAVITESL